MPNPANVQINEIDQSFNVAAVLKGISYVEGITKRGAVGDADDLIPTWEDFLSKYGGYLTTSDFPHLCKRAFDRGAQLRINRVVHFDDITDPDSITAETAVSPPVKKLVLDAALVADNQIEVTINGGLAIQEVFDTDSNTTLQNFADAITADANVEEAFVVDVGGGSDDDREIVIIPKTELTLTVLQVTLGASQAGVTQSDLNVVDENGNNLFEIKMSNPGLDYNNMSFTIGDATNGDADYFNLTVTHATDSRLNQSYENLIIDGNPDINDSSYLDDFNKQSYELEVSYKDLSALTGQLRPRNGTYIFEGGTDGDAVVAVDYVGDSGAGNGFHAFDGQDDGFQLSAPEMSDNAIHIAGAALAESRKDLVYLAHLSNSDNTADLLVTAREATNIDSNYVAFYAGGVKVVDPLTGNTVEISELGDVIGIIADSDYETGMNWSYAGTNRGQVFNVLGVVNNFGGAAKAEDLKQLANRQINVVVKADGIVYISGNFTAQLRSSRLSFVNTRRYLLELKVRLKRSIKPLLEDPLSMDLIASIDREVMKPIIERDKSKDVRALYDGRWVGGQNYSTIEELIAKTQNTSGDIDMGKYRGRLYLKIIPALQEVAVDVVITPSGVSLEEVEE